jgi:hypothetical protein
LPFGVLMFLIFGGREGPGRCIICTYADKNRLDFNAVEAVVDVTHRYPEIFYPKEQ